MKIFIIPLIVLALFGCKERKADKDNVQMVVNSKDTTELYEKSQTKDVGKFEMIQEAPKEGFLFVDISSIYYKEDELAILGKEQDTLAFFKGSTVYIEENAYDIIDQEHVYKEKVMVKSFDPEYGLFILNCIESPTKDFYEVTINRGIGFINKMDVKKDLLNFKTPVEFVLEGFPNPTEDNPVRVNPSMEATIVANFLEYSYLSVEIEGDWLKVTDDKDCYPGEEPSKKDIVGWIRWRKDGKLILDVRHLC